MRVTASELESATRGSTPLAKRYRTIVDAIYSDLGGEDHLSEIQRDLAMRFAETCVMCEEIAAKLLNNRAANVARHSALTKTLTGLGKLLGLKRLPRDITPTSLADYIDAQAEPIDAEDDE